MRGGAIVGYAVVLTGCNPHPSDAMLISEFAKNQDAYEALADMAAEDSDFSRIADDFVHPNWSLPESQQPQTLPDARWSEYRGAFEALSLESGITIYPDAIALERSSAGLVTSGSSKSFMRTPSLPEAIVIAESGEELECTIGAEGSCAVARQLADGWFLVLERH